MPKSGCGPVTSTPLIWTRAAGKRNKPGNDPQERGLAAAAWSEQADELARREIERDGVDRDQRFLARPRKRFVHRLEMAKGRGSGAGTGVLAANGISHLGEMRDAAQGLIGGLGR